MGSLPQPEGLAKSVCIIGAGPCGLAAAKYLLAERHFDRIVIFEQRSRVGGLWNYVPSSENLHGDLVVPQTSPHVAPDEPVGVESIDVERWHESRFLTPLYDRLETNIPRSLMGFSDLDWPEECQLFPNHDEVLEYIERYATDVRHLIRFETQVRAVRKGTDSAWRVSTRTVCLDDRKQSEDQEHTFDAVLVANGHYNVPHIPSVPGIEAWHAVYPGTITHSKFYRRPEAYVGQKVIMVGNSASGIDIGERIAQVCSQPLIVSQKSESSFQMNKSSTNLEKPRIVEYILRDRSVRFADGSVESNVAAVVYCTGYFYSYPFLDSLDPPVITTGECVENTYQHIFYRPHPTLAFAALNQKVIPFPLVEAQSAVIARVWSGRLTLPSEAEMKRWERETLRETGGGRRFHVLKFPQDADYINAMHTWCMGAESESGHGKTPPHWGEEEYWTRERFAAIKAAFHHCGEGRHEKRTLRDVGFSFDELQERREKENLEQL